MFGYETFANVEVTVLLEELATLQNQRLKVTRLVDGILDLALYGPSKPENEHGYSEADLLKQISPEESAKKSGQDYEYGTNDLGIKVVLRADPLGKRKGEAPLPEMAEKLNETCEQALELVQSASIKCGAESLNLSVVKEALQLLQGAVAIAYPMGLPPWDPVKAELDGEENLAGTQAQEQLLNASEISLWWASKELMPGKFLSDYVGKNEKTKVIVKVQKRGQGAPVKEPPLDADAQKAMMAYYYKKQEEHKKLVELAEDEPDFSSSAWSNPNALKSSFHGLGSISFRPR